LSEPLIEFWQVVPVPDGQLPVRADRYGRGTMPAAALQRCEPSALSASGGYFIFPPVTFSVMHNSLSKSIFYSVADRSDKIGRWTKLHKPLMPYHIDPKFVEHWQQNVPQELVEYPPAFLMRSTHVTNMVQIWTGALIRTKKDWSVRVRGPVNDFRRARGWHIVGDYRD
jgi:hypothetical protein